MTKPLEEYQKLLEQAHARQWDTKRPQSSETERASMEFMIYYDEALTLYASGRTDDTIKISCTAHNYSHNTLHRKLCGGLTWLTFNGASEDVKRKYRQLRSLIKFDKTTDREHVFIKFHKRVSFVGKVKRFEEEILDAKRVSWKEQLFGWLDSDSKQVFDLKDLFLDADDIEFVKQHCANYAGVVVNVGVNSILAIR